MGEIQRSINNSIYTTGGAAWRMKDAAMRERQTKAAERTAEATSAINTEGLYTMAPGGTESVDNRNAKLLGDSHEPNWTVPDPDNVVDAEYEEIPLKYEGTKGISMDKTPKAITVDKSTKELPYQSYHNYDMEKNISAGKLLSQEEYGKLLEKQRRDQMNHLRDITKRILGRPAYQTSSIAQMNRKRFLNVMSSLVKGTKLDPTLFRGNLELPRLFADEAYDKQNRRNLSTPDQYYTIYTELLKEDPTLKNKLDKIKKPYQDPDETEKILKNLYKKNGGNDDGE